MKKILTILSLVLGCAIAYAQDDVATDAPRELNQAEGRYNAAQPNLLLEGRRVVVRFKLDRCSLDQIDKDNIESALQKAGADTVFDDAELLSEASSRPTLRGNAEVDQATVPHKGTLRASDLIAEVSVAIISGGSQSMEARIGSFMRGYGLSYAGEASVTTISVRLRDRATGSTKNFPILKVVNVAKSVDHLGADVIGGLSRRAGFQYNSEDKAGRDQRSFDGAVRKLSALLQWKCNSRGDRH